MLYEFGIATYFNVFLTVFKKLFYKLDFIFFQLEVVRNKKENKINLNTINSHTTHTVYNRVGGVFPVAWFWDVNTTHWLLCICLKSEIKTLLVS